MRENVCVEEKIKQIILKGFMLFKEFLFLLQIEIKFEVKIFLSEIGREI